jgi:NAD+ synthase (glutamine-hydrolysing)
MKLIKVAAGVLNQTPLDWEGNQRRILAAIQAAREAGVSILCLPELCITGYGCEDAFHAPGVAHTARELLLEIAAQTRGMIVSLGLPLMHRGALYNTCALAVDGRVLGLVGKQNLAGDGIHYEPRWFKPWPEDARVETPLGGRDVPLGDLMFDVGGVLMGFEICEDAWVAERPGGELARRGVDVIFNPSASHFAFGKHEVRKRFVIEGSRAFTVSYLYANLVGNESGRAIYDGDAMIASAGRFLAMGPRFTYDDAQITTAVIDVDATRMNRARTESFRPIVEPAGTGLVRAGFDYPSVELEAGETTAAAWETGPHVKEEEFARAVSLALYDYLRKSRSRGFVVSLSGGADSSACAALVKLMVDFGVAEIGRERFLEKLAYISNLSSSEPQASRERQRPENGAASPDLVRNLLTCVYQSTRNSGDVTRSAARDLSEAIGAEFFEFDVDAIVEDYTSIVSRALGRPLTWETDDVALQNIQARVRAPGIWMLANVRGALLLATSNRSEAAVGYTTMDGDTCGGLSPIAGIDKAFLRRWLRWLESVGPAESGSLPVLAAITRQQPTAELRPAAEGQTDEGDLMPYDLLDAVERAAIRDKLMPLEVFRQMRPTFPQYSSAQLAAWVERFFRLWCRNQWKRERYAPSFHLDDENLDPKTWCRFPILSGGFERELAELREAVASSVEPRAANDA